MSDTAGPSVLRARGLRKEYGQGEALVRAVDEVDLDVAGGETVAVMGPSGCGKSTLLHLLGGLDRPSAGELWLAGRHARARDPRRPDEHGQRAGRGALPHGGARAAPSRHADQALAPAAGAAAARNAAGRP